MIPENQITSSTKRVGAFLEINITSLKQNFRLLQKHLLKTTSSPVQIMPIIKANAYGHGLLPCAEALWEEGVNLFGVALVDEAIQLQKLKTKHQIKTEEDLILENSKTKEQTGRTKLEKNIPEALVLIPPFPEEIAAFCEYQFHCVVSDIQMVKLLHQEAKKRKIVLKAHLFLDTGMSREGIEPEKAEAFLEACKAFPAIKFVGLCTHFATSDEQDPEFTLFQLQQFTQTLHQLTQKGYSFSFIHTANSAAIFRFPESHFSLVRPGLSLYGYSSDEETEQFSQPDAGQLKPILSLKTKIVSLRRIQKGQSVGYGRKYYSPQQSTIATLPIGYGDGFSRSLSGKIDCLIQGKRFPIVGTICMDQCMVDIGHSQFPVGEEVVLIGNQGSQSIWADEMAQCSGTIPYEILTALSARLPRYYQE